MGVLNEEKRILLLMILALIVSIGIRNLDLRLRYNLNWFEYYEYASGLSSDEQEFLREKELLVGIYNDPPLSFINEFNNDNAGIMVDYLSQLAIEISNNIHLKAGSKKTMPEAITNKEIDIIAIEKNNENELSLAYSLPLCVVKGKVVIKSNSDIENIVDLKGQTIVALGDDTIDGRIHKYFEEKIEINILEVDNIYQCLALVRNGIAVGFVGDDMEIAHYINVTNRGSNYRFLEDVIYEKEMCLAVNEDNEELLTILNKGILKLKKKNLVIQTQNKWLGDFDSHGIDFSQLELAYKIVTAIIIIVASFSSWNYIITQQVNTKTRELSESKAELRLIIDTLQRGIMVIENDSIIVECNDAIVNLLKTPRENLIGRNHKQIEVLVQFLDEHNIDQVFNYKDAYYYVTIQHYEKIKNWS